MSRFPVAITQEVRIRDEVASGDAEAVRTLVASTGFFHDFEISIAVELVEDRLAKREGSDYRFVFAEQTGEVVGYACYGAIACAAGAFDLYWIAVRAGRRGLRLGRRLMEETERRIGALNGRKVYIETSERIQYEPTRLFYERCGYAVEAVLPDFYAEGDAKIVYAKRLSAPTS